MQLTPRIYFKRLIQALLNILYYMARLHMLSYLIEK